MDPLKLLWSQIYKPYVLQDNAPTGLAMGVVVDKPVSAFALIIGIDEYRSPTFGSLGGAVADAKSVKSYLQTALGVPPSQIITLYNADATRDAIIENLSSLQKNPSIRKGDPILIYYAGHGGASDASARPPEHKILISHDSLCKENGRMIYGLPAHTLGSLLEQLSTEKGDNITVIIDGSHAASEYLNIGSSSYVLLTACSARETAKENSNRTRGVFTEALLNTLLSVGQEKLTYSDLIQRLPTLRDQNPQCEGDNRDRILFTSKTPSQLSEAY